MGRIARNVIGVLALVVGLLLLASYLANTETETRTETFSGVIRLEFDVDNSPVEVTGGDDDVVVSLSASTGFFGGGASLDQVGDTLRLEHDCPGFFISWGCRASFEISVPADITVSGSSSNGPITVDSVDGSVDVSTSNGAITLGQLSGDVEVETSNGAITGTSLSSDEFRSTTSNGRVSLGFATPPSSLVARTSNGAVDVLLPDDSPAYALDTSTSNGEVSADIRTDPAAPDVIDISTSNGDITVSYGG